MNENIQPLFEMGKIEAPTYEHPTVYDVEDPRKSLAPLCPVCGARMDERKKEDM